MLLVKMMKMTALTIFDRMHKGCQGDMCHKLVVVYLLLVFKIGAHHFRYSLY